MLTKKQLISIMIENNVVENLIKGPVCLFINDNKKTISVNFKRSKKYVIAMRGKIPMHIFKIKK